MGLSVTIAVAEGACMHTLQVDDAQSIAEGVRARYEAGTPCIAAGQSMGGLIATHLVLRDQAAWAGLILCSAAIDVEWNLVLR